MLIPPLQRIIRPKKRTAHAYGRDALFRAERLRKEYLKNFQARTDSALFREKLVLAQKRSEVSNELNRIDSFLGHMTHSARLAYMSRERDKLRGELGKLNTALEK